MAATLGADTLTGEVVFFLLSALFACYLAGDSDLTAAALLGRTSLASTFTSAFEVFLAGLTSFLPAEGFLAELVAFKLFTGEISALIGVGLTGVLAGTGLTSDF